MRKYKKIMAGLALFAVLVLSLPNSVFAMMGGGAGGMMGSIAGAMGNMMGFGQQNRAANPPQVPAAPVNPQGNPGYGYQDYQGYGNPGAMPMGTMNQGGGSGAGSCGYPYPSGAGYR